MGTTSKNGAAPMRGRPCFKMKHEPTPAARGGRKHTHTGPVATSDRNSYNALAPRSSNTFDKNQAANNEQQARPAPGCLRSTALNLIRAMDADYDGRVCGAGSDICRDSGKTTGLQHMRSLDPCETQESVGFRLKANCATTGSAREKRGALGSANSYPESPGGYNSPL